MYLNKLLNHEQLVIASLDDKTKAHHLRKYKHAYWRRML